MSFDTNYLCHFDNLYVDPKYAFGLLYTQKLVNSTLNKMKGCFTRRIFTITYVFSTTSILNGDMKMVHSNAWWACRDSPKRARCGHANRSVLIANLSIYYSNHPCNNWHAWLQLVSYLCSSTQENHYINKGRSIHSITNHSSHSWLPNSYFLPLPSCIESIKPQTHNCPNGHNSYLHYIQISINLTKECTEQSSSLSKIAQIKIFPNNAQQCISSTTFSVIPSLLNLSMLVEDYREYPIRLMNRNPSGGSLHIAKEEEMGTWQKPEK